MKRGAVMRAVQVLLQNVTKMPPEKQHAAHPYMSQPSVHPRHKALQSKPTFFLRRLVRFCLAASERMALTHGSAMRLILSIIQRNSSRCDITR